MSGRELVVLLDGTEIGRIHQDARGRLRFVYDEAWRRSPDGYPLSLSMPLAAVEHAHSAVEAWIWGLLPESERVLERWARQFHVARNAFALLAHVGEDCPGAVQLVPPARAGAMRASSADRVDWLADADVAERIRLLRADASAWRLADDVGRFSLAGAQAKVALHRRGKRWGIPSGRTPTTHILKPPIPDLAGHVENEHLCLELARELGLPSASSEVAWFGDEIAIVVERYDRVRLDGRVARVHQEDTCQALGIVPDRKYESQGGPGAREITALLRTASASPLDDTWTFVAALGFAWLTGGTDAHAKNYSLLLTSGPRVRLAPLYDLASVLPYPDLASKKVKLAMKIGGRYRLHEIGVRQWRELARELRLDANELVDRLRAMAGALPDRADLVRLRAREAGLESAAVDALVELLGARSRECRAELDRVTAARSRHGA